MQDFSHQQYEISSTRRLPLRQTIAMENLPMFLSKYHQNAVDSSMDILVYGSAKKNHQTITIQQDPNLTIVIGHCFHYSWKHRLSGDIAHLIASCVSWIIQSKVHIKWATRAARYKWSELKTPQKMSENKWVSLGFFHFVW